MEVAAGRRANMTLRIPHPRLRIALALVAGCAIALGVVARIVHFDDTMLGDELSTLYIVRDHSLRDVLHLVKSDAEISPPLYFVLAWICAQFGSASELIRLPALIAGLASIPLAFLLARRLFGTSAGLVAAALMALNPFMVYYSTEARSYSLAIAFLLGSTLAMLIAAERRSIGWWGVYAALVALAMYAHYTALFVLAAQLLWLLWARPAARVPALLATVAAALVYLPWAPGAIDDARSPTVDVLSALQGNGFSVKLNAIGNWAFGYPYQSTHRIPGEVALFVGIAAVAFLSAAAIWRLVREVRRDSPEIDRDRMEALVLAGALALATPLAEAAILLAGGTDLLGARNLDLASGGFAVLISGLAVMAGPAAATIGIGGLLAVFAIGTARTLDNAYMTADFHAAASFINENAGDGDVVVDMESTIVSPVPTTGIDAQLSGHPPVYHLFQPTGPPPYLTGSPPPAPILKQALRQARGGRLFLVGGDRVVTKAGGELAIRLPGAGTFHSASNPARERRVVLLRLPGWRLEESRRWPGTLDVNVYVLDSPPSGAQRHP
jgi:MFS family permease